MSCFLGRNKELVDRLFKFLLNKNLLFLVVPDQENLVFELVLTESVAVGRRGSQVDLLDEKIFVKKVLQIVFLSGISQVEDLNSYVESSRTVICQVCLLLGC